MKTLDFEDGSRNLFNSYGLNKTIELDSIFYLELAAVNFKLDGVFIKYQNSQ